MTALTHFPKTRLSELVGRLGGINREDAVEAAKAQLESMRGKADEVILNSMTSLEAIVYAPENGAAYSGQQMRTILELGDQIVTLAGTFSYDALDKAARSLCDVTDGLSRAKRNDMASIQVHMRALRMVAPGAPQLTAENTEKLLAELAKILTHHGFTELSEGAGDMDVDWVSASNSKPAK